MAENKLALKALDRLSNAQPVATKKYPYLLNRKKGHKASNGGSQSPSMDMINKEMGLDGAVSAELASDPTSRGKQNVMIRKRRRKAVAAMIVDQLGDAIGQVALKDSKSLVAAFG